jgi:hypothetical protein
MLMLELVIRKAISDEVNKVLMNVMRALLDEVVRTELKVVSNGLLVGKKGESSK